MTASRGSRLAFTGALLGTLLAAAPPARADVAAADKATAEALFDHARALMKEGKYAEACPKLAESQRLDSGLGTMLYLADCYEKTGQTASAWAEFLDAAALARATGQPEREQKARERATAIEPKLNRLAISLATGAELVGIEVRSDGRPLDRALWGRPMPLDPGEHSVSASAPGKQAWSKKVQVVAGDTATVFVVVPALVDEAVSAPTPPAKPAGAPGEPARPPVALPERRRPPPPPPPDTNVHVRRLGYTMIGLGLAGAGVGGVFGMVAMLKNGDATPTCRFDNVCTPDAAASRSSAFNTATISTIVLSSGAGVFAIGVVIAVAAKAPEPDLLGGSIPRALLRVSPLVGAGLGGVSAGGSF